ncbi:MAG: hypothetical protein HY220_02085 [Candidatus Sungbacteria bacterium]|uniref:Uncharacterized protein n=1 Tax=Candidatus Sungiibacteriota bacterium TaxID=2750080 RepID=A0A9D6QU20_9BACT|nr:hypothetical protein [Candidatus Sungbacteria bacterium]
MRIRKWVEVFSIFYLLFAICFSASAHVLKSDGVIGADLHIEPDDDPYVGAPATLYLDFKDLSGKFLLDQCDCRMSISLDNSQLYEASLVSFTASYTFAKPASYLLTVSGTPKHIRAFQPFSLEYPIRVARMVPPAAASQKSKTHNHNSIILYGISAIITFFILYYEKNKAKLFS